MGCVYFVRHGQTVWNVENKICGATDIALTDLGHQQAIETGKRILDEGIQANEILYSPLVRAADMKVASPCFIWHSVFTIYWMTSGQNRIIKPIFWWRTMEYPESFNRIFMR